MSNYYKYPTLFLEVSSSIKFLLKGYNIEHTMAEISLLRDKTMKGLEKAGITQETYSLDNFEDLYDNWLIEDAMNFEINNFYNTRYCLADLR
jgi:hypothetical protein